MEVIATYIPVDRRHELVGRIELPERTSGAALIADLSGFTALTRSLLHELGPRRGAEELARQLDLVYDTLIAEVDRYGGTIIGFSGDAITVWFDGPPQLPAFDASHRATTCGLAVQQAMKRFAVPIGQGEGTPPLAVKVAVAAGPARRFVVGDPDVQLIDVAAGTMLDRVASAEQLAATGEVVLDAAAAEYLGNRLHIAERRSDPATGQRFFVVDGLSSPAEPRPWPPLLGDALSERQVRPWLLRPVYERLQAGQGEFLAELRPAAALFLRFGGIDYDDDTAALRLDVYIREVQAILTRYEGFLIQLTIGDKGSYLYAAFGAPVAHDDDPRRAAAAAIDLRALAPGTGPRGAVQIGLGLGRMRTGSYGGRTRRTYGVLGQETNLAARLMQAAAPAEIVASEALRAANDGWFRWETLAGVEVKGRREPLTAFRLLGAQDRPALHLADPRYAVPMVGRTDERRRIAEKVDQVLGGRGHIIAIAGEAGIGKSRLVAAIVGSDNAGCQIGCSGRCQSYGANASYHVWQTVWQTFFGVDPGLPPDEQIRALEATLAAIDPSVVQRLPLLGVVLNLPIPDNDLTRRFDPKLRKASLEDLLAHCLRVRAQTGPVLLVLEDCHWLDPLSLDLLEVVGRAIADLPVLLVLTYRPGDAGPAARLRAAELPHVTELQLGSLSPPEAEQLIALRLDQSSRPRGDIPARVLARIAERAQGNPFYIEELLGYLYDLGLDARDTARLDQLDLPASLHSLILSRIDRLSESQKATLKVASVVGHRFQAGWLWGAYPELGTAWGVVYDLETVSRLQLISLDVPEPELTYFFSHVTTQEVAYETLMSSTRASLHEHIGQFIEQVYADALDRYVDVLAFHYERSTNEAKKRAYLRRAGEAAQAAYANSAAIYHYERLLPLLDGPEKVEVMLRLGQVLELVGQWDGAGDLYRDALRLAEESGGQQAQCERAIGALCRRTGEYAEAVAWFERAHAGFERLGDRAGVAQVLHDVGWLASVQGHYESARAAYEESLVVRRELGDQRNTASLLNNLGILARYRGDYPAARALHGESLAIRRELDDNWAIAVSLNNLALLARDEGDLVAARGQVEEAVALSREIGDRSYLANYLASLGKVVRDQGEHRAARALLEESLKIHRELRDGRMLAEVIEDFAWLAALELQPERTVALAAAAASLRVDVGAPLAPADQAKLDEVVASARQELGEMDAATWKVGAAMTLDQAIACALSV
jgi:adenylate cyclase